MTRRRFLAATTAFASRREDAVRSGVHYLWRQQGADGGWHSRTYGLLRSGQSLTKL